MVSLGKASILFNLKKYNDNYRNYKKAWKKFIILPVKITANETKIKIKKIELHDFDW